MYLIGAGPGGVDNLTVRALRLLRACDVLVYDDLGASDIVDEAPDAEKVYVGKRGGASGSWKQPDIDALLVRLCLEGRVVARLKGGCPSVLSRAHSELDALDAAGCARELVPGVSSAPRRPLSADIVLTEKTVGRHFSVASAHDPDALDFTAFAGIDTCVFLMVGRTLEKVVQRLGMSRDEGGAGVPGDAPRGGDTVGMHRTRDDVPVHPRRHRRRDPRRRTLAVRPRRRTRRRGRAGQGKTWRTRGLNIRATRD